MSTALTTTRKERIEKLIRRTHPSVAISTEALDLMEILVENFLSKSLEVAAEKADERVSGRATASNNIDIRTCDFRAFFQDELDLDCVGFAFDDLIDETAVGSRTVLKTLLRASTAINRSGNDAVPSRNNKNKHVQRLQEKKEAIADAEATEKANALAAQVALPKKKKQKRSDVGDMGDNGQNPSNTATSTTI
jgi:hypothetical protein